MILRAAVSARSGRATAYSETGPYRHQRFRYHQACGSDAVPLETPAPNSSQDSQSIMLRWHAKSGQSKSEHCFGKRTATEVHGR